IMERPIDGQRCGIPSRVRCKPAVKQVKAAQILDGETIGEAASQFERAEEVKTQCKAATVIQLDLALVPGVIVLEMTRFLDRIDGDRRRAADRAHRGNKMPSGNARDLCG